MYSVSNSYINKLKEPIQERRVSGTLGSYSFDSEDVLAGSFSINSQAMNKSDIKYGAVGITTLSITLFNSFAGQIPRATLKGAVIEPSVALKVDDDTWESVPCGVFTVDEALWNEVGVAITAYDNMSKFDKPLTLNTTYGKAYDLLSLACVACDVSLGVTRAEIEAMPNGIEQFAIYAENDMEYWRDLISWVAQVLGGFATCDRSGALVVRQFGNDTGITLGTNHRFTGITVSDFSTNYTGVSLVNMVDDTLFYLGAESDTGLTMNLGSNPLLQDNETLKVVRLGNILNELLTLQYTPFSCKMIGDIAFDLGDVIHYSGGVADNEDCCIMAYNYIFGKDYTAQGFGENPALSTARSKSDKNLAEMRSGTKANVFATRTFVNAEVHTLAENVWETIVSISFTTINATTVSILHEIQLDCAADDMSVEVKYMLDTDEVTYHPEENWKTDGKHLLTLMYFLDVEASRVYTWTASLKISGGSAGIAINNARACLSGQGLAAVEKWNGRLGFEDELSFLVIPQYVSTLMGITDTLGVAVQEPVGAELIDSIGFFTISQDMPEMMGISDFVTFKKYLSDLTWDEASSITWDVAEEQYIWGDE